MSMSDFITELYRSSWIPLLSMPKENGSYFKRCRKYLRQTFMINKKEHRDMSDDGLSTCLSLIISLVETVCLFSVDSQRINFFK